MNLRKLELTNFRNFAKKEFEFSGNTTLIVGKNTAGKTNLFEAVWLLATGHSFRGGKDEDMLAYGQEIARVKGELDIPGSGPGRPIRDVLEIVLTRGEVGGAKAPRKKYQLDGAAKKATDFVGHLKVVLFRPEDLEIIIGSPSTRRDYLDFVLEQVDYEYRRATLSYRKGLRQRNKLLEQIREQKTKASALFFWNKLLVENGSVIAQKRKDFLEFVNGQPDYFGNLKIEYDHSTISPEGLEKYQDKEIRAGMTLIGPHRDDLIFTRISSNESGANRDLSVYGSRGEKRLAVFSLKLAELEFMRKKTNQDPLLLLDDIFSELDEDNRERLLEVIPKQQTFITTTDLDDVDKAHREEMERIEL